MLIKTATQQNQEDIVDVVQGSDGVFRVPGDRTKPPKPKFSVSRLIKRHPLKCVGGAFGAGAGLVGLYNLVHDDKPLSKTGGEFDIYYPIFDPDYIEDKMLFPSKSIKLKDLPHSPNRTVKKYNPITGRLEPKPAGDVISKGFNASQYKAPKHKPSSTLDNFNPGLYGVSPATKPETTESGKKAAPTATPSNKPSSKPSNKPSNKPTNKRARKNNNKAVTKAVEHMPGKKKLLIGGITALGLLGAGLLGSHIYNKHLEEQDNG